VLVERNWELYAPRRAEGARQWNQAMSKLEMQNQAALKL
jgi:hypothetical protein